MLQTIHNTTIMILQALKDQEFITALIHATLIYNVLMDIIEGTKQIGVNLFKRLFAPEKLCLVYIKSWKFGIHLK